MLASIPVATPPSTTTEVPVNLPVPVDAATAKLAWKEGVALFDDGQYAAASDKLKLAAA